MTSHTAHRVSDSDLELFAEIINIPYVDKQFSMRRYLGLTDKEITEWEEKCQQDNIVTSSIAEHIFRHFGITAQCK